LLFRKRVRAASPALSNDASLPLALSGTATLLPAIGGLGLAHLRTGQLGQSNVV
jgi:hypothetical protein